MSLTRALLAASLLVGCGAAPAAAPRTVSLRMAGHPDGATVTIDDRFVGPLVLIAARGVALPRGRHRVSVEAPGYFPWDAEIEAQDAPVTLSVRLEKIPD